MKTVANLACSYSRCTNYYLYEVDDAQFSQPREIVHKDDFVVKCFDFDYQSLAKRTQPLCGHKCANKSSCGHPCCGVKIANCVIVDASGRDGVVHKYYLLDSEEELVLMKEADVSIATNKDDLDYVERDNGTAALRQPMKSTRSKKSSVKLNDCFLGSPY